MLYNVILRILGVLTVHSVEIIVCTKILSCGDSFYFTWYKRFKKDNLMEEKN